MTLVTAAVLLGLMAGAFVVLPILRRSVVLLQDAVPGGVVDAHARRRVALASLKEIEYDRAAGKLDDQDYARLRSQLEREALLAMEAADRADASAAAATEEPAFTVTHACGYVNPPGSRFCAGCGARL